MFGVQETGACVVGMPSKDTVKVADEADFVSETPRPKESLDSSDSSDIFL